jgi:ATP-dependent protease ClpP protease subunit
MDRSSLQARVAIYDNYRIANLKLHGEVGLAGGFESRHFHEAVKKLGRYDMLFAYLDSPGGSVFDAWIIHDYLKSGPASRCPSLALITGQCSGTAILIALGFQQILMRTDAYMRFRSVQLTNANAAHRATRQMAKLIASHAGCEPRQVLRWIRQNYVFTAKQCLRFHLCHAIV